MLYTSPYDDKELLVVGINAKKAETRLQAMIQDKYSQFTIFTDSIEDYTQHTKTMTGGGDCKAFNAIKEIHIPHKNNYEEVSRATCELILQGRNVVNQKSYVANYAFVSAHFALDKRDMEKLNEPDVHEGESRRVQEVTSGKALNARFALSLFNPRKWVTLRLEGVLCTYRYYQQGLDQGQSHHSSFMTDAILMEIEESKDVGDRVLTPEEMEEAMRMRKDGMSIGNVFPVNDIRCLLAMGGRRVKVKVGASTGYMILPGIPLKKKNAKPEDRPQICHIQFIINDW